MDDKTITKAKRKALENLYKKEFDSRLKVEIIGQAERAAAKVARELAKDPKFQKQLRAKVKQILEKDLNGLVAEATKDAMICW